MRPHSGRLVHIVRGFHLHLRFVDGGAVRSTQVMEAIRQAQNVRIMPLA